MEMATFGAGCFWGIEEIFRKIKGVVETKVGYMGGTQINPSYQQVCSDKTGHAEVVHITFNPGQISYNELLKVFWNSHDPTTLNRQGPDVGSQYRSVIFYHSPEQKEMALQSKRHFANQLGEDKEVVTQVIPAEVFYPAEAYHQRYLEKIGGRRCY